MMEINNTEYFPTFSSRFKGIGNHKCSIPFTNISMKSPQASKWEKIINFIKLSVVPHYLHPDTSLIYRSSYEYCTIVNNMQKDYKRTIHPFSLITMIQCVLMFTTYYILFLYRTLCLSYGTTSLKFSIAINVFLVINMIITSMTGYEAEDRIIILEPKLILKRYMKKKLFFDLLDLIPFVALYEEFVDAKNQKFHYKMILISIQILQTIRTKDLKNYFRISMHLLRIPSKHVQVISVTFIYVNTLHFITCLVYICEKAQHFYYDYNIEVDDVEFSIAKLLKFKGKSGFRKYIACANLILSHFKLSTYAMQEEQPLNSLDIILLTIILIVGYLYTLHLFVTALHWYGLADSAGRTYEEYLGHIVDYLHNSGFSARLKQRVMIHFKLKHKNRYFDDKNILNVLSEHLNHEVITDSFKHMLRHVRILHCIPLEDLGGLMSRMTLMTVAPNEVVLRFDDCSGDIYIISRGVIAFYSSCGLELFHLEDGEIFGVLSYFLGRQTHNVIACTYGELYKWNRSDFLTILSRYPTIVSYCEKVFLKRYKVETERSKYAGDAPNVMAIYLESIRTLQILKNFNLEKRDPRPKCRPITT